MVLQPSPNSFMSAKSWVFYALDQFCLWDNSHLRISLHASQASGALDNSQNGSKSEDGFQTREHGQTTCVSLENGSNFQAVSDP